MVSPDDIERGSEPPETLKHSERVRRRSEFRQIQSQGQRVHTPHFVIIVQQRPDGPSRLGITATKRIGPAVARNRIKRLVREVWRRNKRCFPPRCDVVFIAKAGASELDYGKVAAEVTRVERSLRAAVTTRPSGSMVRAPSRRTR